LANDFETENRETIGLTDTDHGDPKLFYKCHSVLTQTAMIGCVVREVFRSPH
jgi:hypothetical protein